MSNFLPARALAILIASAASVALAQPAPALTAATLRPFLYQSALEGYQAFSEEKVRPWKEANDNVGKIGGWRAYAKEASAAGESGDAAPQPVKPQADRGGASK